MNGMRRLTPLLCMLTVLTALTACRDVLGGLYDDEADAARGSELQVDASSWTDWYYVDLTLPHPAFSEAYPIPTTKTGDDTGTGSAIVSYWYDVFGQGLSVHERRDAYATAPQAEPSRWTLAVHRNNVRTNGGAVCQTHYTSLSQLPPTSEAFADSLFVADAVSEHEVWTVQDRMLEGVIGNQRIAINPVLSGWLRLDIPPMPPRFTLDPHVFILRLADGTHAALRLQNYMNSAGRKCYLTIDYRYPY